MRRERSWLQGGLFALLTLIVPVLVGYDVYFQVRAPVLDFSLDQHTGIVQEVPFASCADVAGLHPGDVILSVNGVPFNEWHTLQIGNFPVEIERDGRRLTLELPIIPLAKVNTSSLLSSIAVSLIFWGSGLLLLLRRAHHQNARIFFLLSQVLAAALLPPLAHPIPLPIPRWMPPLSVACFHLASPLFLHYTLTFPRALGNPRQRRWWLSLLYGLALAAVIASLSHTTQGWLTSALYTTLLTVGAIGVMLYVYRRHATPDERRRLRVVALGTTVAAIPPILLFFLPSIFRTSPLMPHWLAGLFLAVIPLSYVYAIVRHNLFEIDRLLNRTLVYAILSLVILLLYIGLFLAIYRFAPGDWLAQAMVAAGLTLLVSLIFDRSRQYVQQLVDRMFYGGWYDYPTVVETVSDALTRTLEEGQLNAVLSHQVPSMMRLRDAQLCAGEPGATSADSATFPLVFPLLFQGEQRALWAIGPRLDGDAFSAEDRRILATLAHQAEIALGNVLLVQALRQQLEKVRQAQHRLFRSREEERSRLARDLHDNPIQTLVGLNLHLGLLLAQLEPPPAGKEQTPMTEALSAMRVEVKELLSDLRQVCAELRPPMLDTLGLGAALRALADDWSAQCDTAVNLDLPSDATLRPLPDEVAVNLYRVAQEALANVARHAEAQLITIQLTWEDSRLVLTVQDDGRGFVVPDAFHNLAAQGHFGLVGMQERIDLIGGTWVVESAPGRGTTVRVVWHKNKDTQD